MDSNGGTYTVAVEGRTIRGRRSWVVVALLSALALCTGCSTVTGSFMQRVAHKADASVIEAQVCRGDVAGAIAYMEDVGMPRPDRTAALERARAAVQGRKECPCAQQASCVIEKEEVHAQP